MIRFKIIVFKSLESVIESFNLNFKFLQSHSLITETFTTCFKLFLYITPIVNLTLKLLLGDYKILIAAGDTATGKTNSVEIIDLETTRSNCSNFPLLPRTGYALSGYFGYNNSPLVCGGIYYKYASYCT